MTSRRSVPRKTITSTAPHQRGAALLIFFIVLFTASSSVFLRALNNRSPDMAQQAVSIAEMSRAKEALLAFAVMAVTDPDVGPGRLPCPDTDNDENGAPNYPCNNFERGRLPRIVPNSNNIRISPRDGGADNQFWYVVSPTHQFPAPVTTSGFNAGSSGELLLDGRNDIVAVIIDAGTPLVTLGDPTNNATHYLESENRNAGSANIVSVPPTSLDQFNDRVLPIRRTELMSLVTPRVAQAIRAALVPGEYPTDTEELRAKFAETWIENWLTADTVTVPDDDTDPDVLTVHFAGCDIIFTLTPYAIERSSNDC